MRVHPVCTSTDAPARVACCNPAAAAHPTRDKQVLTIPVESLPGIPEGPFKLQVLVTNIFNVSSASQARAVKHNSTDAPLFELDKSANAFHPASGFVVEARPLPASCVFARTVWDWSTDIPNVSLEASSTGTSVALSAWDLVGNVEEGKPYTITLRASYEGSDVVAVDHVTLTAVGSPLSVSLAGPSGTVPMDGNLTFDASGSYDPDDPDNAGTQLSYLWTCINDIDRSPCFGSPAGDGLWMLDAKTVRVVAWHARITGGLDMLLQNSTACFCACTCHECAAWQHGQGGLSLLVVLVLRTKWSCPQHQHQHHQQRALSDYDCSCCCGAV